MSFPVRLEEYFFPVQSVKANSKHAADEDGTVQTQILRNVKKISDDEHVFSVELIIHILQKECSNAPYFINLSVYGVFKVDVEKLDNTQINALVESTGVSVLYGAARERVASLTSRGPWGVYNLDLMPLSLYGNIGKSEAESSINTEELSEMEEA